MKIKSGNAVLGLLLGLQIGAVGSIAVVAFMASSPISKLESCDDPALGLTAAELRATLRTVYKPEREVPPSENVAVGIGALNTLLDGSFNTAIGVNAGDGIVHGSGNTIIGRQIGSLPDVSNTTIVFDGNGRIVYCRRFAP